MKTIAIAEHGQHFSRGDIIGRLGEDIIFDISALESYAFADRNPVILDAMIVAASIEYADRVVRRPPLGWARHLSIAIPVEDPEQWRQPRVLEALGDATGFLTGDYWHFEFRKLRRGHRMPEQAPLALERDVSAILAFSDGLDSWALSELEGAACGQSIVRVRLGYQAHRRQADMPYFTAVPFRVHARKQGIEATARSRGFKFGMLAAIAAYLTKAERVVVPESGQGIFGPVLSTVGHGYHDYRSHPRFTARMERLSHALFGHSLSFSYPRMWATKGETLQAALEISKDDTWRNTRSCWQPSRWCSVNGKRRHCGVCAACLLRRLSVHTAGHSEVPGTYACEDLSAPTLQQAAIPQFTKVTSALWEYAVAGVLHLENIARLAEVHERCRVQHHAQLFAPLLGLEAGQAAGLLLDMLGRHAEEWDRFLTTLSRDSFVVQLAGRKQ